MNNFSPHARESKTASDPGLHAVEFRISGTGFKILCQCNLDSEFQGKWDPDSLSCIPDSTAQGQVVQRLVKITQGQSEI